MAKNDNKKVPGALIAIVAVIIAVAVFVPTVYMPYKNKKPIMDSEHQEAVDTIQMYEDSIRNQAAIEKNIAQLEAEWEQYQKDYFVDANSSLADLQKAIEDYNFHYTNFERGGETEDESGKISFTGSPLYYVTIDLEGYATREDLLDFLNFVEKESVGCYYVKEFSAITVTTDTDVLNDVAVKEGDLDVSMEIYLYYYNQKIQIDPSLLETDTDSAEA